jgi:hypothetical protein
MAVYFASNLLGNFSASSSVVTEISTPTRWDPTFVQSAISLPPAGIAGIYDFASARVGIDATSVTTIWSHGEVWLGGATSTYSSFAWSLMEWVNAAGVVIARLRGGSAFGIPVFQFQYWNGATYIVAAATMTLTVAQLTVIDAKLVCGANGSIDIYQNGTSVISVPSSTGLSAAVDSVVAVRFCNPSTSISYWSQIALTDYDTRSIKVTSDVASAAGTYNDGTGAYTDTNSLPRDLTKARVLPANGNKFSSPHAARAFPGNMIVQSLLVNSAMRRQGDVVTNARPGLYIGGVYYPMGNVNPVPNGGYEVRGSYVPISPATLAIFTQAEYNALEYVVEART